MLSLPVCAHHSTCTMVHWLTFINGVPSIVYLPLLPSSWCLVHRLRSNSLKGTMLMILHLHAPLNMCMLKQKLILCL